MNFTRSLLSRLLVCFAAVLVASTSLQAQEVLTYYHTDVTGSPVAGSDVYGNVLWREDFAPYGEKRIRSPVGGDNRRGYTGHAHDDDTGLTYAGARHYDPMIGRFMSVDPVAPTAENQFSFSRYVYGNNNPHRFVDPDGRDAKIIFWDDGKVDIQLQIHFFGAAANSSNIASLVKNIETRWTGQFGQYDVTTTVQLLASQQDVAKAAAPNSIELVSGPTSAALGHSFVRNGHTGEWTMDDALGLSQTKGLGPNQKSIGAKIGFDVAAHEAGHLLGLPDYYSLPVKQPWMNGTLMDSGPGNRPVEQDIQGMANSKSSANMIRQCQRANAGAC